MAIDPHRLWFAIKDEVDFEVAPTYVLFSESVPELMAIEEKMPVIKAEFENAKSTPGLFLPYFEEELSEPMGTWDTIPLYTFDLRRRYCRYFPELTSLLERTPGVVGCFISRLRAGASIARHSGITNGIYRCQIGLDLPSGNAQVSGFCVADTVTGLYDDRFIAFVDANAHWAWNRGESDRIILIVDIIRPQFRRLRYFMSARIVLSYVILRLSTLRGMPFIAWFIKKKFSRRLINWMSLPFVPFFYVFAKGLRLLRVRHK